MRIRIRLTNGLRQALVEQLQRAYASGQLRLVKRIHALLYIAAGFSISQGYRLLTISARSNRDNV